jgi:hypothetical protein
MKAMAAVVILLGVTGAHAQSTTRADLSSLRAQKEALVKRTFSPPARLGWMASPRTRSSRRSSSARTGIISMASVGASKLPMLNSTRSGAPRLHRRTSRPA